MNSNNWNTWKSYLEELVDPKSIDTSNLLSKPALSEDIWTNNEQLKPEILQAALRIANEYFEDLKLNPNIKIKDIRLTGSLASISASIIPFKVHSNNPEVVVIGAGAAGLAATDTLLKNGISWQISSVSLTL